MASRARVNQWMDLGLGIHAAAYVAVVGGLTSLNSNRTSDKPWILWVARGWGIGLAAHAAACQAVQERENRTSASAAEG